MEIVQSTHPEIKAGLNCITVRLDFQEKMFHLSTQNGGNCEINLFDIVGVRHPGENLSIRAYDKPKIANIIPN